MNFPFIRRQRASDGKGAVVMTATCNAKRSGYLSWDDYFMAVALLSAQRSKDPSTQVGACIVNRQKRIVGVGYNGFPTGCSDDTLPWCREGEFLDTKYPYVCHAELNAILNSVPGNLTECVIYTGLFPCNECAKVIIQAGIREVVFLSDKYADTDSVRAAKLMFDQSRVAWRQLVPANPIVTIQMIGSE
jgi:dCMP deaminase